MAKVYGYCRVSSREQAENTHALEQQCDRIRSAGAEELFVDVESGSRDDRKQFNNLMGLVKKGQAKEIVVTRLDRLTRSLPTLRKTIDGLQKHNCNLRALDDSIDLKTAAGKFHLNMLGALAEMEVDRLSERVRHGWEHLRDRKVAMNSPFGYCKVNNQHELDHAPFLCLILGQHEMSKAVIAREIVEAFLKKRSLRLALREINERYGIQTFAHGNKIGEKKGGRVAQGIFRFSVGGLSNWLTNPVLQGHLPYLRRDGDRSQIHLDTHPKHRLISDGEFKEIESILAHNKKVRGYGSTALKYPCSGLVFCAECRGACYSLNGAKNYHKAKRLDIAIERNYYFQCKNWGSRACNQKTIIRMEVVEAAVIDTLVKKAAQIANIAQTSESLAEPETPEIQKLRSQMLQLQQANSISPNPAIQGAIAQIENQITQLRYSLSQNRQANTVSHEVLLWAFSDPELWKNASDEDKKRVYRELVEAVVIRDGQVVEVKLNV
ncbi:fdxN element excision recombinase XisF [Cylindrospermum sp. FACHB-282]|uniref:fdxN element excision recombinase XisF n=1 Tax=Cylindrospermum sp. FACHB-282 TaxID=2692794 RepID=UPI00168796A1|nr:fdxN element excision recombinase XisF [Cylindrospermum sp. FACHB-282]MBD2386049.1 recombinase family protein [Cylindrospermum sp. FACHB-282]